MVVKNSKGLSFDFLPDGSVRSIEADPIMISMRAATPFSGSMANLWLRKRTTTFEFKPLLGAGSNSRFKVEKKSFISRGSWSGLEYSVVLRLSNKSMNWQWSIDVKNISGNPVELDIIYVQDAGLKPLNAGLINEYYVSQYLERRILDDSNHGAVICCRQNMKESAGNPWMMIACSTRALSASVDGMQFYGRSFRENGIPEGLLADTLGGEYSGESSVLALQQMPFTLTAGENRKSIFVGSYLPDHPEATSENDIFRLPGLLQEFNDGNQPEHSNDLISPVKNLFNTAPFLISEDLSEKELENFFGRERRHCETEDGRLLSFFCKENNHVMLRAKETLVDRPHAHIMQAEAGFVPDENIVSVTSFAHGVFNSHLSQGNTNFNILLSVNTSAFNLAKETGQRIFVNISGTWHLLGVPSAFEIGLNHCRWIYKHAVHCLQVRNWTSKKSPGVNLDFRVIEGSGVSLLITHHFDSLNGWNVASGETTGEYVARPAPASMIAGKFPDARFRIKVNSIDTDYRACGDESLYEDSRNHGSGLFVLDVRNVSDFCMSFIGELSSPSMAERIEDSDNQWNIDYRDAIIVWHDLSRNLSLKGDQEDTAAIREILPWYGMNALTHFLTPYGIEQFSGAAWGTRDISQGPIDLLLCMEKYNEARKILKIIFSNQNPDGGWPQWWMFDSYREIRAGSSHGDIYYWCIIALSKYIKATGDLRILDEELPYYHPGGLAKAEKSTLAGHVDRLIEMILNSHIPGTALVPFDGGDWNDSLQPVSRELAERMISSWTVEMNYQAFDEYRAVYEQTGEKAKARILQSICNNIRSDFNRFLIKDGVVAGYGILQEDGTVGVLLHPSDRVTGISYSILPMDRGIISGIFTREQAEYHQELIEKHLKGPDGARLMDRPLRYKGGIQSIFQRAESSTFFGREIGLMYVHEHIRYAESLAITGRAEAFLEAVRQAIPVAYRDIVPCGDIRQSNCYYSSSDVVFRNRYEADELYDQIKTGKITLRGGWRVYSSGPGIFIGLIVSRLLGVRVESGNIVIDPVIPASLDGLSASMDLLGHSVTFKYNIVHGSFSPEEIDVNGKPVEFVYEFNKYRKGGALIPANILIPLLDVQDNIIEIKM